MHLQLSVPTNFIREKHNSDTDKKLSTHIILITNRQKKISSETKSIPPLPLNSTIS